MRYLPVADRKRLGFSGPRTLWRHGRPPDTVTWWKSRRHYVHGAGVVSNRKSARYITEAPPPKPLEVEPENEASQDDV